jgi:uncharacterized protein YaaW (UPF0174 family)
MAKEPTRLGCENDMDRLANRLQRDVLLDRFLHRAVDDNKRGGRSYACSSVDAPTVHNSLGSRAHHSASHAWGRRMMGRGSVNA